MLCCEYHSRCFCQVPSSPFLKMSNFTPKEETPPRRKLERKRYDILFRKKMIYIDLGFNRPLSKPTSDEKILKIKRLLKSKFFHFESSPWHKHRDLSILIERSCVAPAGSPCSHTGRHFLVR